MYAVICFTPYPKMTLKLSRKEGWNHRHRLRLPSMRFRYEAFVTADKFLAWWENNPHTVAIIMRFTIKRLHFDVQLAHELLQPSTASGQMRDGGEKGWNRSLETWMTARQAQNIAISWSLSRTDHDPYSTDDLQPWRSFVSFRKTHQATRRTEYGLTASKT